MKLIMTLQNNTQAQDNDIVQVGTTAASGSSIQTWSALAMTVLESDSTYQAGASDRCIGVGPSKDVESNTMGLH